MCYSNKHGCWFIPHTLTLLTLFSHGYKLRLTSDLTPNPDKSQLVFSLVDSNVEYFSVERYTGVVTVINQNLNKDRYRFNVKVSDWT